MQTFVPFPDFAKSAKTLDNKRLGKQRVEAFQILNALRSGGAWQNHPAVRMWEGHEQALEHYYNACIDEWEHRGFKNSMQRKLDIPIQFTMPLWWGRNEIHDSHKARLFQKDPSFYMDFECYAREYPGYIWPVPTAVKHVEHVVYYKNIKYIIHAPKNHTFHPAFEKR